MRNHRPSGLRSGPPAPPAIVAHCENQARGLTRDGTGAPSQPWPATTCSCGTAASIRPSSWPRSSSPAVSASVMRAVRGHALFGGSQGLSHVLPCSRGKPGRPSPRPCGGWPGGWAAPSMSALFDFRSFLTVLLLAICSCTYAKMLSPQARQRAALTCLACLRIDASALGTHAARCSHNARGLWACSGRWPGASVSAPTTAGPLPQGLCCPAVPLPDTQMVLLAASGSGCRRTWG